MNMNKDINSVIFERLRMLNRYEQFLLLEDELLTLFEQCEEGLDKYSSEIVDLFDRIDSEISYEKLNVF